MSPRPYRLGKREATMAETRSRIIDAATALFAESPFHSVSMDEIASSAGVARATVYYQFASKYALLEAVLQRLVGRNAARAGGGRVQGDVARALESYVETTVRFWSRDYALFCNVIGAAAADPDAAAVADPNDERRRALVADLIRRIEDAGRLTAGMTRREATDTVWVLTSFRTFDQLHGRGGLSVARIARMLNRMAGCVLRPSE